MTHTIELTINGSSREASSPTIAALLQDMEIDPRRVAVEVNQQLVPRELHETHPLAAGDRVEVVTLVGGG